MNDNRDHTAVVNTGARSTCRLIAQSVDINGDGNFLQGCSFSPDGLCILTYTVDDAKLRLYNTVIPPLPLQDDQKSVTITGDSINSEEQCETIVNNWSTVLSSNGGDSVRCYSWYPLMKSSDPGTCCFIAASRDQPVHLYDAYVADHVRASYRPYNSLDEMEAPNVVTFSNDGQKIMCGGFRTDRTLHIFDTSIPGRDSTIVRLGKTRRSSDGQKGLISSISFGSSSSLIAVGTYAPGSIYLYDLRSSQQPSGTILNGHCIVGHGKGHARKKRRFVNISKPSTTSENKCEDGVEVGDLDELNDTNWLAEAKRKWYQSKTQSGVTQLQFAPNDDYILYSASRRSNSIIAWDIRMLSGQSEYQTNPIQGLSSYETINNTNQRLEFDIDVDGKTIYIGGEDNCLRIYDIKSGQCKDMIHNLDDSVNGVSHTVVNGCSLLAIVTGSRRFASLDEVDDDVNCSLQSRIDPPGYLRLYNCTNNRYY